MIESVSRRKYDTSIIWLYCSGKEHLLPDEFRNTIPHSTASTWRNTDFDGYLGSEFRTIQNESLEWYELFHSHEKLKKTVRVIARVWVNCSDIILPVLSKCSENSERIINEMQRLITVLPKETALRLAGLSIPAFRYRIDKIKYACQSSPAFLCLRRHPLQLSFKEVEAMKNLLANDSFACWPVTSLAYYAQRNDLLYAAISTWYKYMPVLGIKRAFKRPEKKATGIKATRPNEYLHVDTTYWTLENGTKMAITFVSDNYSRAILGWAAGMRNCADNVKEALQMAIQTIRKHYPQHVCATLVADGGSENHAVTVAELLEKTKHPEITKIIALKDISFSNSPIEAINKIMKRYLRYYNPTTEPAVCKCIELAVPDYSEMRPHGSLKGAIPMEAYTGNIPVVDFSAKAAKARAERIAANQKANCGKCEVN